MYSHRNEIEDAEEIELTSIEESGTESIQSLIVSEQSGENQLPAQDKAGGRCFPLKAIVWKILKIVVFSICLISVVIQAIEFYNMFSKYPTNVVQKTIIFDKAKIPAVTICFKNMISTKQFCDDNPDWCERPNNLEWFCKNHPIHCIGDISKLRIPMTGYYTNNSRNLEEITRKYLIEDKFNDPYVYQHYIFYNKLDISETRTFVQARGLIYKCYSHNLHLYQSASKLVTPESNIHTNYVYGHRNLELYRIELFGLPGEPQVFLAVHSPFIPINPVLDGQAIRLGYYYDIKVQLEKEEHLLPAPYQTNCRDNGPSMDVKNFTNPNSYEMCLDMCDSEMAKALFDCVTGVTMSWSPNLCPKIPKNVSEPELHDKRLNCYQKCQPGCLILHYNIKLEQRKYQVKQEKGIADIEVLFRNRKVILERHDPLYANGALLSHVGGLLGYWLGISVFTSLHIVEKIFKKLIICCTKIRKNKVH